MKKYIVVILFTYLLSIGGYASASDWQLVYVDKDSYMGNLYYDVETIKVSKKDHIAAAKIGYLKKACYNMEKIDSKNCFTPAYLLIDCNRGATASGIFDDKKTAQANLKQALAKDPAFLSHRGIPAEETLAEKICSRLE